MTYFSHSKIGNDGNVYGTKKLIDHVNGVLEKAHLLHSPNLDLGFSDEDLKDLLKIVVQFHDLGKYTSYFQNYLLKKEPIDGILKQHSRIGGFAAYNLLKEKDEKKALLALFLIFLHHSQLIDILQISERLNDNLSKVIDYQKNDLQKYLNNIQTDLRVDNLSEIIHYPEEKPIRRGFKVWSKKNQNIKDYFLINYLFSLLIESDKLDASDTIVYIPKSIEKNVVDKRFGNFDFNISKYGMINLSNNQFRNFCRAQVISNLEQQDILDHYIFTLTAPTGIGKTMISLDFALKLKAKVKEESKLECRIIYALPFINIIEQAIKEYKDTLPVGTEILGHYQYADFFGEEKEKRNEDGAEQHYNQRLMALDTWQSDVVITSFVQFFETLIGNRNKLLKKFNHYANSIIILDEVQTLRLDQMPLLGAVLFYLAKFLKSRIILMTATKPKIFEMAQEQILSKEGETVKPLELLDCYQAVFSIFERTKIVPLIDLKLEYDTLTNVFIKKFFSKKWESNKSCIIVCNTVKRSIEIFEAIKIYLEQKGFNNPIEYLSTNIIPAHRFDRISELKEQINSDQAPILVSTQVVEAGVDLDFDMGFRDLGPIDSIIQVAGRVNRNNNPKKKNSPLYIVDFGDAQKIYGRITSDQAKLALEGNSEFLEKDYLNIINKYFDNIKDKKSFSRFNKIFESMKMLRYDSENSEDCPVSNFKIIEESVNTTAVFIEQGEYESNLKEKYLAKIKSEISKTDFDKYYKQDFNQRIIAVPKYYLKSLEQEGNSTTLTDNIMIVPKELLEKYYNAETGFIRKKEDEDKSKIVML
ncbi:MAG: CRISPR-associated helicase Cas3' [Ignavibacteria bacterium]|nr:CRISPR-associated helicase Cas3' [Ignavibacteria bacterium]